VHYRSIHASDNKNGDEQYLDMLSQLEETINKYYGNGHQVIVCGNMNASTNSDNRSRDKHVQHFLERNSLRQMSFSQYTATPPGIHIHDF
jgi:phosphoheptose isomerase